MNNAWNLGWVWYNIPINFKFMESGGTMKKRFILLTVLCIMMILAGCAKDNATTSGSSAAPAAASSAAAVSEPQKNQNTALLEPSALISQKEAEDILGKKLSEAKTKEQKAVGLKLCIYEAEDVGYLQIGLTQQAAMPGNMTPKSIYDGIIGAFPDAKKAEGVGDEAYYCTPGIHIMRNGYYINVALGNSKDTEKLAEAGKLAVVNLDKALGN